jgi:epoxyqueuosine reductase
MVEELNCRSSESEAFKANPGFFVTNIILAYAANNLSNRLPAFGCEPIFDNPIIGFARASDKIFSDYKTVIGDFHLTPLEAWKGSTGSTHTSPLSVISIVFPITLATRQSLRAENTVVSLRWNHARFIGQDFINGLCNYVISTVASLGHQAVAPDLTHIFKRCDLANGPASNWSQRHIAYAAGLGTFSLNDAFITPKGIAVRLASLIIDIDLEPTPRLAVNHLDNCLYFRNGSCGKCIQRCPVNAISKNGHDKFKCRDYTTGDGQRTKLKEMGREGYIGKFPACGLCQTGVPCEDRVP